jgi:hypothetical protein
MRICLMSLSTAKTVPRVAAAICRVEADDARLAGYLVLITSTDAPLAVTPLPEVQALETRRTVNVCWVALSGDIRERRASREGREIAPASDIETALLRGSPFRPLTRPAES